MKKKIILSIIFFISIICIFNVKANAASVEKTSVSIYALDEEDSQYLKIPNNYMQNYTIKVNGTTATPKFTITEGADKIEVDSKGKITPKKSSITYWSSENSVTKYRYNYGTAKVNVAVGTQNIVVTVNVIDYVLTYCDNVLNDFIKNNIKSSMSDYEKLVAITKYTAEEYDYGNSTSYVGMILNGSGSCWGSTSMIVKLCDMVGIKAHARNGNKDAGAGSGHYNAVALICGKLYEAEAGYSEPKPRYYYVRERASEFTLEYNTTNKTAKIVQYDGFNENIVVPSKIGEYTITEIGDSAFYRSAVDAKTITLPETIKTIGYSAFYNCQNLESVNIPKSVTEIKGAVFSYCPNLKTIKTNGNFVVQDNVLYNGSKTKLIQVLGSFKKEKLEIPSTVTEIGDNACYYLMNIKEVVFPPKLKKIGMQAFYTCQQLQKITIPGTCKEIGAQAFGYCIRISTVVLENGVTTIGERAFECTNTMSIQIPKSVTNMGKNVFFTYSGTPDTTIYGEKGSTAETYAKNNNLKFIAGELNILPFNDVNSSDWYYNSVKYTYKNNIIKGLTSTTFAPKDKVTRGMLVTILHRMEGSPAVTGKPKFSDVQDSKKYYYEAVKWATTNKIVNGYNNGKFGPNDNITREQLAVILHNYATYKKKNVTKTSNLSGFKDVSKVSNYALPAMKWAVGSNIISGKADKTLAPKGNATRAETATIIMNYCLNIGR